MFILFSVAAESYARRSWQPPKMRAVRSAHRHYLTTHAFLQNPGRALSGRTGLSASLSSPLCAVASCPTAPFKSALARRFHAAPVIFSAVDPEHLIVDAGELALDQETPLVEDAPVSPPPLTVGDLVLFRG